MSKPKKIIAVAGARPNFMKIAPLMRAFDESAELQALLVHTGQHYDEKMSKLFFEELEIPAPDINLEVGSGSHAVQTAEIIRRFEPVVIEEKPDLVLVVGDVNSTIACALVASKLGVKIAHVEAGLRSFDRTMPEEINRMLTDSISDLLFVTEQSGVDNLLREGVAEEMIHFVGNVMIDTLHRNREKAARSKLLATVGVENGKYAAVTLHRPANVDSEEALSRIADALDEIQRELPIVFPVHPRTRSRMESMEVGKRIQAMPNMKLIDPLGYLDFLQLTASARVVLTDSGGIQEETTILGVPCLTLRENTERPVTIDMGTNRLVGTGTDAILSAYRKVMSENRRKSDAPPLWDGKAAERIAAILTRVL